MNEDENWDEYLETFSDRDDNQGLTLDDENEYRILRNKIIDSFGEKVRNEDGSSQNDLVESLQNALNEERRIADEARGKTFRLLDQIRGYKNKIQVYESHEKYLNRSERSSELAEQRLERKKYDERNANNILLDRLPPQNVSLERTVLGIYLSNPKLTESFPQKYLNLMFYSDANRILHSAIIDLGTRTDRITIECELRKRGDYESVGGVAYIDELEAFSKSGNPDSVNDYIEILEEHFLRRQLIRWCTKSMREAYNGATSDKNNKEISITNWVEHIRLSAGTLIDILPYRYLRKFNTPTLVDEVVEDFQGLIKRNGKPKISTGYKPLDRIMHGILEHRLVMVGGRTKIGKTTFSLSLADNAASQGRESLIFTFESSKSELIQKLISKYSGVDSERFVYWDESSIPDEEINKIMAASEIVKALPIYFDSSRPDADYIVKRTQQMKSLKPNLSLVIVDGLQSFAGYIPYQGNKSDVYYEILKKLKDLAVQEEVCVLVNSQLKQDVEKRKDKRPKGLEDFSDCKGIPEVADTAICLHRPEFYYPDNENFKGYIEVIPMAMRVGDKKERGFRLGVDMRISNIYEL